MGPNFEAALVYASELHRNQLRKTTGSPYVGHLLGVAAIVLEHGGNEDEAIAALLHDAVEDQGGRPVRAEILRRFGPSVLAIVDGCTEDRESALSFHERKRRHLESVARDSSSVALVYAADKLHNGRTILIARDMLGNAVWSHFGGGRDGVVWYYRTALQGFRGRVPQALFAELEYVVERIGQLNPAP